MNGYGIQNVAKIERDYSADPTHNVKIKKPGFFKRWLLKQVKSAQDYENKDGSIKTSNLIARSEPSIDQPERAVQFTVYNANGGRVVETRKYDRQKDRHHQNLYIITNDQEFGREIDKIITMEALR